VGSIVYNQNRDNLAPVIYQDRYEGSSTLANGTATIFQAVGEINDVDLDFAQQAVLVYVGGILQTTGYTVIGCTVGFDTGNFDINVFDNSLPLVVEFDEPPTDGYQVTIQVRRGLSWYGPGSTTEYDGAGLEYTDTVAAQFFRG
jgi:hypothetical protein